jgi:Ras-related protein Rab-1A
VYYLGADGIIMVYDLSDPTSVDDLENYWIAEAEKYCDKSIKVLLLGNKCDTEKLVNPNVNLTI